MNSFQPGDRIVVVEHLDVDTSFALIPIGTIVQVAQSGLTRHSDPRFSRWSASDGSFHRFELVSREVTLT